MNSSVFLAAVVWGSVVVVAGLTVLAWRQRPKPGATAFALTMLTATCWVTASSLALYATTERWTLFWSEMEWIGIAYFPVAWVAFALAYTGRSEYVSRRSLGLMSALPTVSLALALTNGVFHDLVYGPPTFHGGESVLLVERSFGPWIWVHVAYSNLLVALGTALVLQVVAQRRLLYRGQALALVLAVAAPWVGNVVYLGGFSPVPFFDPTPYLFVISGAAGIAALTHLEFLDAVPVTSRVAHRSVVENVDAGVLVADTDGQVVEANPRARALLADDGDSLIGDPVSNWAPAAGDCPDDPVIAENGGGRTQFLDVRETELADDYGNVTGRVFLLRDVTDRRNRVQRLNVLNRVLRHNLRNEMNVIYGQADRLEQGDLDRETAADDIREKATELTELANKAREIDRILGGGTDEPTDLARVVDIERRRVADAYGDVTVEARVPDDRFLVDAAAGTVVRNVLENAAEHNTAAEPWARIALERDGDRVRVEVADNGPGIPPAELAALNGDPETQLDHASGLGLWLVRWGVTAVGGTIDVADRAGSGTRVALTFPVLADESNAAGVGEEIPDAVVPETRDAERQARAEDSSQKSDASERGDGTSDQASVPGGSQTTEG